jgi:peptidyl-prolyl cis-trans isomerase D
VTMLDRMRQHKNWLKWSLGIVVAAFILLYIPSFLKPNLGGTAPTDAIATVDGRSVLVGTYQRAYQQQLQSLRAAYGDQLSDQMLKQLGVGQRVMQQLIDEEAMIIEAERLGLTVSDAELRERILRIPGFQQDGQFIGEEAYRRLLQFQRPPMRPDEFEAEVRRSLMAEKLQALVTGWVTVTPAEVEREYRHRNEKVKLDLAIFTADQFRKNITPTDAEIQAQFDANKEQYRTPEKRHVRFLSVDAEALRAKMTVTPQEVEARYKENLPTYSTPEQIRASHILFKTEGKDEEAVRKQAEAVLAKAKAGADFAALAKQYSDDGSKDAGGDLDYFGRGTMVKEFDDAAWALQPGQISDLVKSQFGFHIIKLTDKKPAVTRTLNEVRPQIEDQIKYEKAQQEAARMADAIGGEIKAPADLDRVARAQNLAVGDSGFFARDEPLAGLGFAPAVAAKAFEMTPGQVSDKLATNQGYAWITLVDIRASALPALSEVKDRVRDDVVRLKAVELARAKAAAMAQAGRTNFAAAAKAAGVDVKTTDLVTRGTALPEVGVSQKVDDVVFAMKSGDTSAPIATDNAVVVARVKERQDVKDEDMPSGLETLKAEMLQQRQNEFFSAYMAKAKTKMKLTYSENTIRALLGAQ